jgi:hypothetical protein
MDHAGVPRPDVMNLHPSSDWKDPLYIRAAAADNRSYDDASKYPQGHTVDRQWLYNGVKIAGEIAGNRDSNAVPSWHRDIFAAGTTQGEKLPITLEEFNTISALHESTHWVAGQLTKNGASIGQTFIYQAAVHPAIVDLNDQVFDKLVGAKPQTAEKYIVDKTAIADKLAANGIPGQREAAAAASIKTASEILNKSLKDRIAYAGMTLYALSNYGDTQHTKDVLKSMADIRLASIRLASTRSTSSYGHDTSSSINAAIDAFEKNPKKGMSIVDTTKWASKIIEHQKDLRLTAGPDEFLRTDRIRQVAAYGVYEYETGSHRYEGALNSAPYMWGLSMTPRDVKDIKQGIDTMIDAKKRLDPSYKPVTMPMPDSKRGPAAISPINNQVASPAPDRSTNEPATPRGILLISASYCRTFSLQPRALPSRSCPARQSLPSWTRCESPSPPTAASAARRARAKNVNVVEPAPSPIKRTP